MGIEKSMLEAIELYYNDETTLISHHVVNMLLLSCPQDPIRQLRDALNELKAITIARSLVLLTSIGKYFHVHC